MILVTTAQMREIDRRTIEEFNISGEQLMERAGNGVAMVVRGVAEAAGFVNPMIHLIAGRGQNGGDAFVAARVLKEQGWNVEVWLAAQTNQISGDSLVHFGRMKAAGIEPYVIPFIEEWHQVVNHPFMAEIIVDGVLGTGLKGPARGPAAGAIKYIRAQSNDALVVSIDVPSGLNADTGLADGQAVQADVTATIALPKVGLLNQAAIDYVGSLDVIDIGIPAELIEDVSPESDCAFIHAADLKRLFPRRMRSSHKGVYGDLLVIAGSRQYGGAAILCARAALRSGAGRVMLLAPASLRDSVIRSAPEIIFISGEENAEGALSARNVELLKARDEKFNAVVVGPGLTVCPDTKELVEGVIKIGSSPMVLDADAINIFEGRAAAIKSAKRPIMLTPHPGELSRLMGVSVDDVQNDRVAAAESVVKKTSATVALKGAGTLVAARDWQTQVNMNGNPGMATAGSGDVLAGVIGGLLAQGLMPFDAARAGVYVHGRAGDYGSLRRCQISLIASDIIDELPYVFRELSLR